MNEVVSHVFKPGDKNESVKLLQRTLRESVNNALVIDGDYGNKTKETLCTWQSKLDIEPSGLYIGQTKEIIDTYINKRFIQEWCYKAVAKEIDRDVASFTALAKAIAGVESRKEGFTPNGNVTLLFERHVFKKQLLDQVTKNTDAVTLINSHYDVNLNGTTAEVISFVESRNPDICNSKPGGYLVGIKEQERFNLAVKINPIAATNSASFGLYQIMGFNAPLCGYSTGYKMMLAFMDTEYTHLLALAKFLEANKVIYHYLKNRDYNNIAKIYNGPAYAKNNYHIKISNALNKLGY